jgi:hypothetical protein
MAKGCGCAGTGCSCVLVEGVGTSVRGAGTVTNPYVVDAQVSVLSVIDSPTVDLELLGDGTETNPYVLTATYVGTTPTLGSIPAVGATWNGAVNLSTVASPTTIRATLTGNVTSLTLPSWGSTVSGSIYFVLSQDGTGSRTWVQPGTNAGGTDIVLSTAANARDFIEAFWTGVQWVFTARAMNIS